MSLDNPVFGYQGRANSNDYFGEYNQLLFMIRQVLSKVNVAALCEVLAVHGANGKWTVISLQHELESRMPDGKWFTTIGVRPYVFG